MRKYKETSAADAEKNWKSSISNRILCLYHRDVRTSEFCGPFYHMGNEHETYQYLEQTIVPMICNTVRGRVICTWAVSNGFGNMYEAVRELDHAAEWNLILKKGTLICKEKIQKIALYPYK